MANRAYRIFGKSLDADKVSVWAKLTFGANGQLTSSGVAGAGPEVQSVKHTGTGIVAVQFDTAGYASSMYATVQDACPLSAAGPICSVSGISASAGLVTLNFATTAAPTVLADPGSGYSCLLNCVFNLSSLGGE